MRIFLPGAIFTEGAFADVKGILRDLVEQENGRESRFRESFTQTVETLVTFPNIGSPRNFADVPIRELRMFPVKDFKMYLIYYHSLASDDGIEIVRVLHEKRDAQTLLAADFDSKADS